LPAMPHDSADNWRFLSGVPYRMQLSLSGHTYILGSDRGPVYLSRVRETGVEGVVCEFSALSNETDSNYRVLGAGERLPGDLAETKSR
jgi:hypothetical protein